MSTLACQRWSHKCNLTELSLVLNSADKSSCLTVWVTGNVALHFAPLFDILQTNPLTNYWQLKAMKPTFSAWLHIAVSEERLCVRASVVSKYIQAIYRNTNHSHLYTLTRWPHSLKKPLFHRRLSEWKLPSTGWNMKAMLNTLLCYTCKALCVCVM